ncbi:hypothetical protein EC957_002271 [Mortierella hygrophila]|uniref:F-box domain-containing protein n=1 Tax=Mortierella hygrophila TaxID=979708 RepID=A0A9P6F3R7_9FUNG|nr:hypothetical protein EC957_002271 [Mortierella hygrophila]
MTSSTNSSPPPLSPLSSDYDYTLDNDVTTANDSVANKLPPEILERILNHVTIASLPSCCLVNKLWSLCGRPFLWRSISPQDVNDEDFIAQFAKNYQNVRDLKVCVPCDSAVHQELLKPSPSESSVTSSNTAATSAATAAKQAPPSREGGDEDSNKPTITATKTLLDCRRLTALHLQYSVSLIHTLPHFRDSPHRPSVAPAIRLMIKSAEKIIENNVATLRNFQVMGLCFPVSEPILKLIEKMPQLETLSFLKWVDYEGEEFFRMMVSASSTLEELSIEMTDVTVSYSTIVLLYGWRHVYDEHQKSLLATSNISSATLRQSGAGSSTTISPAEAARGSEAPVAEGGEADQNEDEDWIPGTRTTPSFAVMSAKTVAGTKPLDRLTNIKSLSLDRSTLNTQFLLRLAAVMPELTALSLKQIYGIGNDDDMLWDMETESLASDDMDMPADIFGGFQALGENPFGQAAGPAGLAWDSESGSGAEEELDDLPDLIPALDGHNNGGADEESEGDTDDDMPDLALMEEDSDDDLPDLEPVTSPLHVVNPDAGTPSAQSQQPAESTHSPHALDEDEMDYDDAYEDGFIYDPYDDYSEDYSEDEADYGDDIWGYGGGTHYINPMATMGSILAQHVPPPMPHSSTQGATALSKAFRTLHPLCPKIDTFDFSGSRSEALNEIFFDTICELWGTGSDADAASASCEPHLTHMGLKVLNAADVCKVGAKFFSSIGQRCSTTLTGLDLSLNPKMMWQLRSSVYEIEVRQGTYYDEILQILMTCPALEHLLVGPYPVNGKTIAAQETDWVATRLRTLHLCVEFDAPLALSEGLAEKEVRQVQTKVCQQLGRLSRLETLTLVGGRPVSTNSAGDRVMDSANIFGGYTRGVARPGSSETPRKYIDLKLSSGLEHLAGLKALETLDVVFLGPHGLRQEAELEWVLTHWPKLHTITGFWDRAKLRASVRKYREDLKVPANTPASGPAAYFAKRRREQGVRLRPELELSIDPKVLRLNNRMVHVDARLLDDLLMEEGMETTAVIQESGIHKMYTPAARKAIAARKAEKAKAAAAAVEWRSGAEDGDENELVEDDGDEEYTDVSDEDENQDDGESDSEEDVPGVTRFNWYVRYIGGAGHAPWDAGHGGIRNGELMTEVMRPREGGRSPSPLGTWY